MKKGTAGKFGREGGKSFGGQVASSIPTGARQGLLRDTQPLKFLSGIIGARDALKNAAIFADLRHAGLTAACACGPARAFGDSQHRAATQRIERCTPGTEPYERRPAVSRAGAHVQPLISPVGPQEPPCDKHRAKRQEHERKCEPERHGTRLVQTGYLGVACGLTELSHADLPTRRIPGTSCLSSTARARVSVPVLTADHRRRDVRPTQLIAYAARRSIGSSAFGASRCRLGSSSHQLRSQTKAE